MYFFAYVRGSLLVACLSSSVRRTDGQGLRSTKRKVPSLIDAKHVEVRSWVVFIYDVSLVF